MRFYSVCMLLLLASSAFAQLLPVKKNGRWGAINANGQLVIQPSFDFIGEFDSLGRAVFKQNGLSGVINAQGQQIIAPAFEQIRPISEAFFAAWKDGLCGAVNAKGETVVKHAFERVEMMHPNFFKVYIDQQYGISDREGNAVLAAVYQRIEPLDEENPIAFSLEKDGKFGLAILPAQGNAIATYEPKFDRIGAQGNKVLATQGQSITSIAFDAQGMVTGEQQYLNETAYNLAQEQARKKAIMEKEADPKKPRWQKNGFHYSLTDAFGNNLFGNRTFFMLNIDDQQGLAMGISENAEKKLECWVIDPAKGKKVFHIEAKDLSITDFQTSEYARITIDTLFDGLVSKQGQIIDKVDGQDITNIGNFVDGRAAVQCGKTFGFFDTKGQLAIPLIYEVASTFENGHAIVKKGGLFGLINPQGKELIPCTYDGITMPSEGLVRVKKGKGNTGKWGMVSLQNQVIADFQYTIIDAVANGEAVVRMGSKLGVIDKTGKVVVPINIQADKLDGFQNGISRIQNERLVENIAGFPQIRYKYQGYVDRAGATVVPPKYEFIYSFDSVWQTKFGLAKVVVNNLVGYINAQGQEVIAPIYTEIEDFEQVYAKGKGLAKIKKGDKFGYIDASGKVVLEPAYTAVDGFAEALADTNQLAVANIDGKFGYINYQEKPVIPIVYERISPIIRGAIIAQMNGKVGVINLKNEPIVPFEYDGARFLEGASNLLLVYKQSEGYAVIDGKGQVTSTVREALKASAGTKISGYKYATDFDAQGLAIVEAEGLKGVADKSGKLLIKPKFKDLKPFSEGMAAALLDHKDREKRKWGYINMKGDWVIEPAYTNAGQFGNGKAPVNQGRLWGYVDAQGNMALKAQYRQAESFSAGYAVVNQTEIINEKGELVGKFDREGTVVGGFENGRAIAEIKSGQLHIMPNGDPAYYKAFDEVTPFIGDVAFVKRGEKWELVRQIGSHEKAYETRVPFTKYGMNQYVAKYGKRRKISGKPGEPDMVDISWEKVSDGRWRMIDRQGNFLNETTYESVVVDLASQTFKASLDGLLGVVTLDGKFIAPPVQEVVKAVGMGVVRVESEGKVGYLRPDGTWIWPLQQ